MLFQSIYIGTPKIKKKSLKYIFFYYKAGFWVISREIRPLAALYPPPYKKVLSVVAGGGIVKPTAFAPLSI